MELLTHALSSLAVARVAIPRAPWIAWATVILAGTISDLDSLSAPFGAPSYLRWHRTYLHSIVAAVFITLICAALYRAFGPRPPKPGTPRLTAVMPLLFGVSLIHLALDACQSDGIAAFWPFSLRRMSADWLGYIDPWIITILVAAILLPELLRLVNAEIGSKDNGPRGRAGALLGLAVILIYIGARAMLHSNVIAATEARSYRGESPRRVDAFPESASPFTWRAVIETDRALHQLTVNEMPGASFDPEVATVLFKPESSPALEQARQSDAARKFLAIARFPKASIEKTQEGYEVQFRDLRYAASRESQHELAVRVETDPAGRVRDDELVWARDLRRK